MFEFRALIIKHIDIIIISFDNIYDSSEFKMIPLRNACLQELLKSK